MPLSYDGGILTWTRDTGIPDNTPMNDYSTVHGELVNLPLDGAIASAQHGNLDYDGTNPPPPYPVYYREIDVSISIEPDGGGVPVFGQSTGFYSINGGAYVQSPYRTDYLAGSTVCPLDMSILTSASMEDAFYPFGQTAEVGIRPTSASITFNLSVLRPIHAAYPSYVIRAATSVYGSKHTAPYVSSGGLSLFHLYGGEGHTSADAFFTYTDVFGDGWTPLPVTGGTWTRDCVDGGTFDRACVSGGTFTRSEVVNG